MIIVTMNAKLMNIWTAALHTGDTKTTVGLAPKSHTGQAGHDNVGQNTDKTGDAIIHQLILVSSVTFTC